MKHFLRKLIPESFLRTIRPYYHGIISLLAHYYFGKPSEKLIIIGVTGTNGKTTTVNLTAAILKEAGLKPGFSSTANYDLGSGTMPHKLKMTTPSGWILQKRLAEMVRNNCKSAIIEISSEGLAQNRHLGIHFDIAVFTNLTPEHIESHGGFENYKAAKGILFEYLTQFPTTPEKLKIISGLQKTIVVNSDSEHTDFYKKFAAEKYISFSVQKTDTQLQAKDIRYNPEGINFTIQDTQFNLHLKGQFDVYNSLAAVAVGRSLDIPLATCQKALSQIAVVPGRVEVIPGKNFTVVVDYAYEPEEMRQLYETISRWPHKKVIQVLGPTGGGRDTARIPLLGKMASEFADKVLITTDDPYDEDPEKLALLMKSGTLGISQEDDKHNVSIELDRRKAIHEALKAASEGDIVLITGKGADQKMALANDTYIDWDDRLVAREELAKLKTA